MAIFSLHHEPIGKTTQARPYTASAHIDYIARRSALTEFVAERLPDRPAKAAQHFREIEHRDRANARVIDKVMVALPRELTPAEQVQLVREYAGTVTQGRAGWLAAFHTKGKDERNPHAHIVFRDRDHETGLRVAQLSEKGSTKKLRALWQEHANRALERAGQKDRISHLRLVEQGQDRAPTIHEGPRSRAMHAKGKPAQSHPRRIRNGPGARSRERLVDYPAIDQARSRPDYNRAIRRQENERDFWHAIDADRQYREFVERGFGADARRRPLPASVAPSVVLTQLQDEPIQGLHRAVGFHHGAEPSITSLGLLVAGFQPPADRVAGVTGAKILPDALGQAAEHERQQVLQGVQNKHKLSLVLFPENSSEKAPMQPITPEEEARLSQRERAALMNSLLAARIRARHAEAEFRHLLGQSYRNPDKAYQRFKRYADRKGWDAALNQLAKKPRSFGHMPGSILHRDGYQRGAGAKRGRANEHRQHLPQAAAWHLGAGRDAAALNGYMNGPGAGPGTGTGFGSGPTGKVAKQPKPIMRTPPNRYEQQAKNRAKPQAPERALGARAPLMDRVRSLFGPRQPGMPVGEPKKTPEMAPARPALKPQPRVVPERPKAPVPTPTKAPEPRPERPRHMPAPRAAEFPTPHPEPRPTTPAPTPAPAPSADRATERQRLMDEMQAKRDRERAQARERPPERTPPTGATEPRPPAAPEGRDAAKQQLMDQMRAKRERERGKDREMTR